MAEKESKPYIVFDREKALGLPPGDRVYKDANYNDLVRPSSEIEEAIQNGSLSVVFPIQISQGGTGQQAKTPAFDALAPTTTKGDLIAYDGTDNVRVAVGSNGQALVADSAQSSGIKWQFIPGFGKAIYGDGADGALTLVADTTLASGENVRRYTSLTLAGFILTANNGDEQLVVYVSGTLSLGGGTLRASITTGTGGSAGAGGGGGGAGGTGGLRTTGVWVYAHTITGTGTISAKGANGSNGANGVAATGTSNGSGGINLTNGGLIFSTSVSGTAIFAGGAGLAAGGGGAGGAATNSTGGTQRMGQDLLAFLTITGQMQTGGTTNLRVARGGAGGGAGGGGGNNGGTQGAGGGGGGAGSSYTNTTGASAGGAGGAGAAGASGTGGGGGGGGASGAVCLVITESAPSTLTVSANGGNGGTGGNGNGEGGGGGGGGAGSGGIAILVAQPSNGATVTAAAGSVGTGGAGAGGGAAGTNGSAGAAGTSANLARI